MSSLGRLALLFGVILFGASCAGPPAGRARPSGNAVTLRRAAKARVPQAIVPTPRRAEAAAADEGQELEGETGPVAEILMGWADDTWMYLPTYIRIIRDAAPSTHLMLVVDGFDQQFTVSHELGRAGVDLASIEFVHGELDSMWMRDYGPLIVRGRDGKRRIVDASYGRRHDDRVPAVVAHKLGWAHESIPIELDGGHLQSDGQGHCVVSQDVVYLNEDEGRSEKQTLDVLRDYLGCRQIVLVPPLLAEETGHVDVFLYVTGPRQVLLGRYRPDQDRGNQRRLDHTARILTHAGFVVRRIPMPGNDHRRVFRTYTNALAANGVILVPTYRKDRRFERAALNDYRRIFPARSIVPIPADHVIELGGALHCLAMTVESN